MKEGQSNVRARKHGILPTLSGKKVDISISTGLGAKGGKMDM